MTNASGFNETILFGLEASFKTLPGTPAAYKLPVGNPKFSPTVTRFTSEALTGSAQPRKPVDGKVSVQGSFDLECNTGSLGPVLSGLMASERVQGAGSYRDHVYTLGTPQSWYQEQQFSDISQYFLYEGNRVDKADFTFDPEGLMKASVSTRGARTTVSGAATTADIDVTDKTLDPPLSYLFSGIRFSGVEVFDLQEVKLSVDRQAEDVKCIDATNELADIITKICMLKGSLKALFQNRDLFEKALNSTECAIDLYVPSSVVGKGLWVKMPTLLLMPSGPTTNGPGGLVTQEFSFDAYGATAASVIPAFTGGAGLSSPVTVNGSNDTFVFRFEDAPTSDVTVVIAHGGGYGAAEYANALNGDVGFSAKAEARVQNSRVVVETLQTGGTGALSSVEVRAGTTATECGFAVDKYFGDSQEGVQFVVTNEDTAVYNA